MGADFSGFATKANLRCSDGRTIQSDAFKHMDGSKVPLVWQHAHNEPSNVLGHGILEARDGDVYVYGHFNETEQGLAAKTLVQHGDITALSIYANKLVEKDKVVSHGVIREVSLVMAGANPGALIDNVAIAHGDGSETPLDDEAVIYTGLELTHADTQEVKPDSPVEKAEQELEHMGSNEKTVSEVFDTFNDEQREVVHYMLGEALAHAAGEESGSSDSSNNDSDGGDGEGRTIKEIFDGMTDEEQNVVYFMIGQALDDAAADAKKASASTAAEHSDNSEGQNTMGHSVFEQNAGGSMTGADTSQALSHAEQTSIFDAAKRSKSSVKEAVEAYALQHGIEDIDVLFPDAKAVTSTPEWIARRTEWVAEIFSGTRKTPFSRIKSMTADITLDAARAKGYVKGNLKKEEFFRVAKRVTTPQTIYKKQKLDRDDILDITDFDVVAWLKGEMRLMLEEEVARAVLLGDGRSAEDEDKISEEHIRPIATDHELYVTYLNINTGRNGYSAEEIVDALTLQRRHYRGSGNPTFFTSETVLAQMLLVKDTQGRRIYPTVNDLSAALRVQKIVPVELMDEPRVNILGILVNLQDYTIGADKGGDVSLFDDFDIDYNQYKYLIESRMSGALIKAKSALVVKAVRDGSQQLATPVAPAWDDEDKTVTVPTTTGVTYRRKSNNATLTTASPVTLAPDEELTVVAVASTGYYLASTANDEWTFTYEDGPVGSSFE